MADGSAIQPVGLHIGLSSDWIVNAVSANIGDCLSRPADSILGQPVTTLLSDVVIHDIRNRMALLRNDEATEHLLGVALGESGGRFDLSIYCSGDGYGVDAEPCVDHGFGDTTGIVNGMIDRIDKSDDVARLCELAARQMRALSGFDNILVWVRGELAAHSSRGATLPQLSHAATHDFMIIDRDAPPVSILAQGSRRGAHLSRLRAPSEEQLAWLESTGARATFVLPLSSRGTALGQICCLHQSPRHIGVERRNVARLFARFFALRLEVAELRSGRSGA